MRFICTAGTGRWSDGSKEWTPDWLDALGPLEHSFGDDGAFIMECQSQTCLRTAFRSANIFHRRGLPGHLDTCSKDTLVRSVLDCFFFMDQRCSSRSALHVGLWGHILQVLYDSLVSPSELRISSIVTFSLPNSSPVIVVLAKMDERYFEAISGFSRWTLDFKIYKKGEPELLASSSHSTFFRRSVNCELDLEAGDYVVHVRIFTVPSNHGLEHSFICRFEWTESLLDLKYVVDCCRSCCLLLTSIGMQDYLTQNMPIWNQRKLASLLSKGAMSQSIVASE